MRAWIVLAVAASVAAADSSTELLAAAAKGDMARIQSLLARGADLEGADRDGRTPLMLAAQHGRAAAVQALLRAGANAGARDRSGLTAYGLALLEPAGRGDHDAVLEALPKPPRVKLAAIAGWSPARLISSCFQRREQLIQRIGLLHPDETLLRELQAYIRTSGRGLAGLTSIDARNVQALAPEARGDADEILLIEFEPVSACAGGAADSINFGLTTRVFRAPDRELLLERSIGGGLKSAMTIANSNQLEPVMETWLKAQAGQIFRAAMEAWMKSPP